MRAGTDVSKVDEEVEVSVTRKYVEKFIKI